MILVRPGKLVTKFWDVEKYYYFYWVFATVSTHLTDETCNVKLGNHREENIQTEGKLNRKLELRTNIQNP
jgi:hypothetical protein